MTKPLPFRIGEEKFMKLDYANAFFMKSRDAYRTKYNSNTIFTFKVVEGTDFKNGEKIKLLQIHLRTPTEKNLNPGKNYGKDEVLDIDMYALYDDFKDKIIDIIKEQEVKEKNKNE